MSVISVIAEKLQEIRQRIRDDEVKYHRPVGSVLLVAASKGQSLDRMEQALQAGQVHFGENYLQEALEKMAVLRDSRLVWHFIGSLQRNKTRKIAENFAWVHTVCEKKIAQRLSEQRPEGLGELNVCIEVKVSGEASKSGLQDYAEILELARFCVGLPQVKLRGLMTVPAPRDSVEGQREAFRKLAELKKKLNEEGLNLDTLSMGMTADYEAAIAEGATIVRLGQGLLGPRS